MKGIILFLLSLNAFASTAVVEKIYDSVSDTMSIVFETSNGKATRSDLLSRTTWDSPKLKSTTDKLFVREFGGIILERDNQIRLENLTEGTTSSLAIMYYHNQEDTLIGEWHTHPYKYESLDNMPFSPRDFTNLFDYGNGEHLVKNYTSIIISGTEFFAMIVEDVSKAKEFWKDQKIKATEKGYKYIFDYLYKKFYSINSGTSIQDTQINSLKYIMKGSGVGLYQIKNHQVQKLN